MLLPSINCKNQQPVINICVVSTFDPAKGYNYEKFKETFTNNAAPTLVDYVSHWEIAKINDYKGVITMNCSDSDRLIAWLSTDDMKQWDEEHGCSDEIFLMDKVKR